MVSGTQLCWRGCVATVRPLCIVFACRLLHSARLSYAPCVLLLGLSCHAMKMLGVNKSEVHGAMTTTWNKVQNFFQLRVCIMIEDGRSA